MTQIEKCFEKAERLNRELTEERSKILSRIDFQGFDEDYLPEVDFESNKPRSSGDYFFFRLLQKPRQQHRRQQFFPT